MAPLNINLGNTNPATINLGPTCITDWFVMDIPDDPSFVARYPSQLSTSRPQ